MERKLLDKDTVRAIMCIKNGYHEDGKNYYGLEAFLYYWRRENGAYENPYDYLKDGAPTVLSWAVQDLMCCSDNPESLFGQYLRFGDEYEFNKRNNFLTDAEKAGNQKTYALVHTLLNIQIRDRDENDELCWINGFSEEAWNEAVEYVGIAKNEEEEE